MNRAGRILTAVLVAGSLMLGVAGNLQAADIQEKVRTAMKMLQSKAADLGSAKIELGTLISGIPRSTVLRYRGRCR
jgi:hypothetical protein